jgi:4-diphosphocytidyl-2-C-methyl-D-erythritol kinase
MPTAVRSHAKINLGLYIGAQRPDGFHSLTTVYQTLAVYDIVKVSARPAPSISIRLTSNDSRVPTDSRNTAWKMVALALESLAITADVEIHIKKSLPVQGGLGAGSANAVAALIGLETELGTSKQTPNWLERRLDLAAQVGSDVPLFLIGGAVLGADRGQQVAPLPDIEPTWCLIAISEIGVSTPQAFRDWDALCAAQGLTAAATADKLKELSCAYASAFAGAIPEAGQESGSSGVLSNRGDLAGPQQSVLVRTGILSWIQNDFEQVVFPQHPSLRAIKHVLAASGTPQAALHASLSGSGSALFGLYKSRGDAEAAELRLKSQITEVSVRSIITRTLPRTAYWREMLSEEVR